MPNHVQNLVRFDRDVSGDLAKKKVLVFDKAVYTSKLAILVCLDDKHLKLGSGMTTSDIDVQAIDKAFASLSDDDIQFALEEMAEYKISALSVKSIAELLNPTSKIEIDWWERDAWCSYPIGVWLNGFDGSYDQFLEQYRGTKTGFDNAWNFTVWTVGTKWCVYDVGFHKKHMLFNTAWSPLSEKYYQLFLQHIVHLTGAKIRDVIFAEQGAAYWGMLEVRNFGGEVWFESGFSDDLDLCYSEYWDEPEMKPVRGYKGIKTPDGKLHKGLKAILPYGLSG